MHPYPCGKCVLMTSDDLVFARFSIYADQNAERSLYPCRLHLSRGICTLSAFFALRRIRSGSPATVEDRARAGYSEAGRSSADPA